MEAILESVEKVILLAGSSPQVLATLNASIVPGTDGKTVSSLLDECVEHRAMDPGLMAPLANLLHTVACGLPTSSRKRKRESVESRNGTPRPSPSRTSDITLPGPEL
ncbi:hypothetical protein FRB90_005402, partial [Tulasnella sp. 427]